MVPTVLQQNREAIQQLCRQYRVDRLDVFGSVLGETFTSQSDIDLLVRFRRDAEINAFHQYFEFKEGLESLLGREVDLVCETALRNSHFIQELEQTRVPLYAA